MRIILLLSGHGPLVNHLRIFCSEVQVSRPGIAAYPHLSTSPRLHMCTEQMVNSTVKAQQYVAKTSLGLFNTDKHN